MNSKSLLASLVILGCLSNASLIAQAAEQTAQPPTMNSEPLQVGDKAPDQYSRSDTELKDWKKRGLSAPQPNTQWVQFGDKYVLINRTNTTIVQIQNGIN